MSHIEIEGKIKIPIELFGRFENFIAGQQHAEPALVVDAAPVPTRVSMDDYNADHTWMPLSVVENSTNRVEILHRGPTVALIHGVATAEECSGIINRYRTDPRLARSRVHNNDDGSLSYSHTRTDRSLWITKDEDTLLRDISHRLSKITTIPESHGELFHLMHYRPGDEFQAHDDFFYNLGENSSYGRAGQRIATAILYLNTVEEGGKTRFSELNLEIDPIPGTVLYFEYTDENGRCTTRCRHAGMPVIRGEKWNLTKWYREKPWT